MGNPLCPKCGSKLTNKQDINVEGITGGISERGLSIYIIYCQKCGYPIGTVLKP